MGIIALFIFMSFTPSIAVDTVNVNNSSDKSSGDDVDWWPMFHHDLNHSGYSTSDAPDTNNVLWNYKIGASVSSSPAVADGRIYIGSEPRFSWFDNMYCLDANTGDKIWSSKIGSHIEYSSPGVADGKVYIGSRDGNVYCLDAITGDYIWSYITGECVSSSPSVADGKVYIGSGDGNVYCLDAITGEYIWNYTTGHSVGSSPAVADGKVYIGSYDNNVYCLDAINGDYIWSYTTGDSVYSSPTVVDGKVYIGSTDDNMYCLNANTGDYIWSKELLQVETSPAVADGKVYIGSWYNVYCLDANTGNKIWRYTKEDWMYSSSPAVADGKVYIGILNQYIGDDDIYCLDANTGDYIWSYRTEDMVRSSPAVADGKVYFSSCYGKIYAFGELNPDPPSAPKIDGPAKGVPDVLYNITFKSESPIGNDLFYWIEWADGSNSGWLGPFDSGVEITESHVWDTEGEYPVQARAKDTNGSVSGWGVLQLSIPRNRATVYSSLLQLLERFPILSQLLHIIK